MLCDFTPSSLMPATTPARAPTPIATVYVVDDNVLYARALAAEISHPHRDIRVEVFTDGFSALMAMGRVMPDLLITDIDMPGLDGLAMLKKLRDTPGGADLQAAVMTAYDRPQLGHFGELPADVPCLSKPVPAAALAALLAALRSRRGAQAAPRRHPSNT
jgi:CheY-like chemotaxis protein